MLWYIEIIWKTTDTIIGVCQVNPIFDDCQIISVHLIILEICMDLLRFLFSWSILLQESQIQ
jgi:hypothetical protein